MELFCQNIWGGWFGQIERDKTQNKDTKKDVEEDDSKVIDKQWQNFISLSSTASRDKDELGF